MMTEKLQLMNPNSPSTPSKYLHSNIYSLQWKPWPDDIPPDISGLPSIDHATYLFNTTKFHLRQHYRFYDEAAFISRMQDFYRGNAQEKATEDRLWFAQFLIVMAFGKAFLAKSPDPHGPPGSKYFVRAMALMPDLASLWKDSLLAIEVLVLAGIYLYSIDQRECAHVNVGQAMRIAQLEGLHTQLPEEELGSDTVIRGRNLWWNLYNLDRHISTSLGLPVSVADSDITTLVNASCNNSKEDTIFGLQVKLSHLLSVISSTICRNEKTQLGSFLESTRSILHTLAGHAQEFESIVQIDLPNLVETETMPRGERHITLLYHKCVIVATRPLLLSLLQERLDKLGHGDENWRSFLALTTNLISTGIKSAVKSLQILFSEDSILVFDLEFAYGAALHLIMTNALFPGTDEHGYVQQTLALLDEMISKGNKVAEVRRAELVRLQGLCQELAIQSEQRGLETLNLAVPEGPEIVSDNAAGGGPQQAPPVPVARTVAMTPEDSLHSPSAVDPNTGSNNEFLDNLGISSYEFFSLVNQLENQDIPPAIW
ncbi:hypothetical protein DL769_004547 [Monosporascus sp. CRB-8-3]|nr:hypothetical protein DL769_004547 [Monosporascus sp. CRB-8-3]